MKEFLKTEIFVPSARGMISDDLIFKINLRVNAVVICNGKPLLRFIIKRGWYSPKTLLSDLLILSLHCLVEEIK